MSITVDGITYALPANAGAIAELPAGQYNLALRTVKASSTDSRWASLIEQIRGRMKGPGGLGVTPPNQRNARWPQIKDSAIPFGGDHGGSDSKAFGYWFNYFWNEAREAYDLNPAGQTQLCEAFFAVLESDGPGQYKPTPALATMDNTQKQTILLKVMRIGFKRLQIGTPPAATGATQAVDARTLFALNVAGQGQTAKMMPLGFRGDNRSYEDLKKTGFMARARSSKEVIYAAYGMDQEWHPFNLPVYGESMFVRKGKSKDNCLHTVISVASSLEEMLPYPLLSDESLYRLAGKDPATWTEEDVNYTKTHWMKLEIVRDGNIPNGRIDKITTIKNIYVLDMSRGKGFNTEGWQATLGVGNPFPERAVDGVLPEQILGVMQVRKHYFYRPSGREGVMTLFEMDLVNFTFLMDEPLIKARFGDLAPLEIRGVIDRGIRNAKFNVSGDKAAYERLKLAATGPAKLKCGTCQAEFPSNILRNRHYTATGHS